MKGIRLADTEVYLEYNDVTHTITLRGATMACIGVPGNPGAWPLQQVRGAKIEFPLLHPDWNPEGEA